MKHTSRRSASIQFATTLLSIAWVLFLLGCTSQSSASRATEEKLSAGSTLIKGAGATFPSLLYKRWFTAYRDGHPDTFVRYAEVGSGEGVRRFIGKNLPQEDQVDFGASDAAMSDMQIAEVDNNVLMVPATGGCVALAYNLPGFSGDLKLSRKAYTGIFLGEIKNWNDPIIAQANPGIKLPKMTIVTVVRLDSSGTTFAFTRNLDAANERFRGRFGPATLIDWPGNAMRAKGNEGVAGLIQKSAGSIGYVGYEFARRIGLPSAALENKAGKFIKPSEQSCTAALASVELPQNMRVFIPDPPSADAYPIATFSWVLLHRSYNNPQTSEAVRKFFEWSLQDGQRYASELGYVPLPAAVSEKSLAAVRGIGVGTETASH